MELVKQNMIHREVTIIHFYHRSKEKVARWPLLFHSILHEIYQPASYEAPESKNTKIDVFCKIDFYRQFKEKSIPGGHYWFI